LTGLLIGLAAAVTYLSMRPGQTGGWVIPGEFEDQQALILAWEKLPRYEADMKYLVPQRQVLADIIAASYRTIPVVVLVSDDESRESASEALSEREVPLSEITFIDLPFDSIWIRDYGPICVKSATGQVQWRDHQYAMTAEGWIGTDGKQITRSRDAGVTGKLASMTGIPSQEVPLVLYGGGVSSNGEGLLLAASDIVKWNKEKYDYSRERITDLLKKHYGAREVVYLNVLKGEPTGHLDVFATFLAADMVVIGSYPRFHDAQNSLLLDANAE
jgi:agmatine deiminase